MITTTPPCGATCKRGSHTKMAPQGVLQSNKSINSDANKTLTTSRCRLCVL